MPGKVISTMIAFEAGNLVQHCQKNTMNRANFDPVATSKIRMVFIRDDLQHHTAIAEFEIY